MTKAQKIKVRFVAVMAGIASVASLYIFLAAALYAPWWASLTVWLVGAVITHVWLYRGMAGPKPSLLDFGLYFQDSGIALTVLLWPVVSSFMFIPWRVESLIERLFGISWNAGERIFK